MKVRIIFASLLIALFAVLFLQQVSFSQAEAKNKPVTSPVTSPHCNKCHK